MRLLRFSGLLSLCLCAAALHAQSVVDPDSPLEEIRNDFGMADGAAWDGRWALYVPDVKQGQLFRYAPGPKKWNVRLPKAGRISATYFQLGQLYLSDNAGHRILRLPSRGEAQVVAQFPEGQRPNDLVVDRDGGIYVTLTGQGQVCYIGPDGTSMTAAENLDTPNGIILSPDGATLYVSEYKSKQVRALDVVGNGKLEKSRVFARLEGIDQAGADGMTIDRAGNVYCCGPDGVWIWNPEGKRLDRIETASKAINATFGDDGRSLYISTQAHGLLRQRMRAYGCSPQPPRQPSSDEPSDDVPSTVIPDTIDAHLDVVYATDGTRKLLADVFVPKGRDGDDGASLPTVVVVHGGGWIKGDKTKFRALALRLAQRGYVTAAIEYRLAYEAPFPAGIHDCNAAVGFLRSHAKQYHIDPQRIAAVGGSAGGHLVGLMATGAGDARLRAEWDDRSVSTQLQAAVVMAGPLQIASGSVAERSHKTDPPSNAVAWLGATIDQAPQMYQLCDAYEKISAQTPPMLFQTGSLDNPDRNAPARERLKSVGVWTDVKIYPDAKHGVWNQLPWIDRFVDDIDIFLKDKLPSAGSP